MTKAAGLALSLSAAVLLEACGVAYVKDTIEVTGQFHAKAEPVNDQAEQLKAFYAPQEKAPAEFVVEDAVDATTEAAWLLCLEGQVDTLLSMWHRESAYKLDAHGAPYEDSRGITQTRMKDTLKWRAYWRARSIELGPFTEVRTQCFFGVAEFREKLTQSRGDVKDAVRRYNGSGPKARLYAERVMISRGVIFGRPYREGEVQPMDCMGE